MNINSKDAGSMTKIVLNIEEQNPEDLSINTLAENSNGSRTDFYNTIK